MVDSIPDNITTCLSELTADQQETLRGYISSILSQVKTLEEEVRTFQDRNPPVDYGVQEKGPANQVPGEHEQKADKKREHYELEHSVPTASVDDPMRKKKFLPTTLPLALLSSGPGRPAKQPKKSFDERFKELERFKQRNHHCYVPDTNNEGERSFLAEWCRNVRSKRIAVTPEQKEMLDGLRFPWEKRFDHDWNVMFEQLKAYKMKHGNCLVPWEWREDPKLSRWVHTQRKSMSKNKMREERKAVLDEIGMVWKPSETRKVGKSTQQPSFQEPPFNSYAA